MLGVAIEPERRGDEQRLADTLHKLTAEDPCVRIEHHAAVNETVLYGMGEFHLRVLLERMAERSEEHTSELQSQSNLVCRLLLEKKKSHSTTADDHSLASTSTFSLSLVPYLSSAASHAAYMSSTIITCTL